MDKPYGAGITPVLWCLRGLRSEPPAFIPLAVLMPPPPVPLVGESDEPVVVPIVPLLVAPEKAEREVAGGTSDPPPELCAKLAVISGGANSSAEAMAKLRRCRMTVSLIDAEPG